MFAILPELMTVCENSRGGNRSEGGKCGKLRAGEASCKREFYGAFAQPQGGQRQHKSRNTCSLATTKISRGYRGEGGGGELQWS